jgi:hypothetical protein
MSDERPPGVLGSLPSTRPHRRSDKRAAAGPSPVPDATGPRPPKAPPAKATRASRPTAAKAKVKAKATGQTTRTGPAAKRPPVNVRSRPPSPSPPPPSSATDPSVAQSPAPGALATVVQAAAELTEIGLKASARALRGAVSRLPLP